MSSARLFRPRCECSRYDINAASIVPDDDVVHDNLCRCAGLAQARPSLTDTGPRRSSLLEHDRRTHSDHGRDLFRACACAAERTGGWTPWTGEQSTWRECSNVLTHGQGVSQIRSKRSNPLITVDHLWYLVTKTAALHGRIGSHNTWHNTCVCAELDG